MSKILNPAVVSAVAASIMAAEYSSAAVFFSSITSPYKKPSGAVIIRLTTVPLERDYFNPGGIITK
jgi:hypothetical protein